jgi:dipeptidase D
LERLAQLAKFYDADYSEVGDYPAWEYRKDSTLRDTMIDVYSRMYGKAPKVAAIHAGLECGLLAEKIENLDCVAMGPTAYDIHTSRERLDIASTQRTYEFVLEVLKAL